MQPGHLVRFKVHHYHKAYGVGVVIGCKISDRLMDYEAGQGSMWVMFNAEVGLERVLVRKEEVMVLSEAR